jgi:hypothetical protein
MDNDLLLRFAHSFLMFKHYIIPWRAASIRNFNKTAFGSIFDIVAHVGDNQSQDNFEGQVLRTYDELD